MSPRQSVEQFMQAFGQEVPQKAKLPDSQTLALRARLLTEECFELRVSENLVEYFDALLDIRYVLEGAEIAAGIPEGAILEGFAEVHRSNMSKAWTLAEIEAAQMPVGTRYQPQHDGRVVVFRHDGKVLKSPSYKPADLRPILERWGCL